MASLLRLIFAVFLLHSSDLVLSLPEHDFPLTNCMSGRFDLLLIGAQKPAENAPFSRNFEQSQMKLFINILDLFLGSEKAENPLNENPLTLKTSLSDGDFMDIPFTTFGTNSFVWIPTISFTIDKPSKPSTKSALDSTLETTMKNSTAGLNAGGSSTAHTNSQMSQESSTLQTNSRMWQRSSNINASSRMLQPESEQTTPANSDSPEPEPKQTTPANWNSPEPEPKQTTPANSNSPEPEPKQTTPANSDSPEPERSTTSVEEELLDNETRMRVATIPFPTKPMPRVLFRDYTLENKNDMWQEEQKTFKNAYNLLGNQTNVLPNSMLETTIDYVRQVFGDARSNSTRVAIMLVLESGQASETVKKIQHIQNDLERLDDFQLFVIMVGFDENSEILNIRNRIRAQTLDESEHQIISMALCRQCKPGWLFFEHDHKRHLFSCYHVNIADSFENWYAASERCQNMNADLASFESPSEISFLHHELVWYAKRYRRYEVGHSGMIFIHIGLIRQLETRHKRFQWVNQNPLIFTYWENRWTPSASGQACAVWTFSDLDTSDKGWWSIGCGFPATHLSICEIVHLRPPNETSVVLKVESANRRSFDKAMDSGEFTVNSGQIVSLPLSSRTEYTPGFRFPMFTCDDDVYSRTVIPYSQVCDIIVHCTDGRDESICQYRGCTDAEFRCDSGQCIPIEASCDNFDDCYDGSDEIGCSVCNGRLCPAGICLPKHWFYDGEYDCASTDGPESHDEAFTGREGYIVDNEKCAFICNRSECVFPVQLHDGVVDCRGPEGPLDETIGRLERSEPCFQGQLGYSIWAPRCVYIKDRYNAPLGCRHMSHLKNCEQFTCSEGYVKCPDSYCIPLHYVQDGNNDCPMGEDEQYIENRTCVGNFACSKSRVCLHPDLVCDRQPHCPYGDDEFNCHVTCMDGFQCVAGTVTVKDYNRRIPLKNLSFVDSRVRYLDLSGIDISSVKDGDHLVNLIDVRLSNCTLTSFKVILAITPFKLTTVSRLDLSLNFVEEIHKDDIFNYLQNLDVLNLSGNKKLKSIEGGAFVPVGQLSELRRLDLSNTGLTVLETSIFSGLSNLRFLNLSQTKLVKFRKDNFPDNFVLQILDLRRSSIQDISLESLKGLTIETNFYTDNFRLCCPQIRGPGIPGHKCQAPNDVISSCFDLVQQDVQRILLWVLGIVAVVGNVLVFSVRLVLDKGALKKSHGLFITNLSVSDFLMGVYLLIIAGTDLKYKDVYVVYDREWTKSVTCQAAGFLSTLSSEVSTFFIFLITVDRFLVIKFPFGQVRFSQTTMILATILAWSLGFILALIPVFFDHWTVYSSNGMCLGLPLTTEREDGWEYSVFIFIGLNFAMFVGIACGQLGIYRTISTTRAATKNVKSDDNIRRVQDILIARQLSLVVLSDFLCWFPIGIMGLLALNNQELSNDVFAWCAVLVIPINSALNPLLYTLPLLYAKWENFKNGPSKYRASNQNSISRTVQETSLETKSEVEKIFIQFIRGENNMAKTGDQLRDSKTVLSKLKQLVVVLESQKNDDA